MNWGSKTDHAVFETELAVKNVQDDDVLKMLDYPAYFRLTDQNLPTNKQAILDKLSQEKLIREAGNLRYHITNLGAVLFATDLNVFDTLSRKAIRVIFYKGKNRLETIKEQIGKYGYAVGFEGLVEFINDRLPVNEEIVKALRREVKIYPEMDKIDKVRACYQHCALKFVSGEYMTNHSLRERFNIQEKNYPTASRIIADTIAEGLIKDYGSGIKSKKYARYIPFWA